MGVVEQEWQDVDTILGYFGGKGRKAINEYRGYMEEGVSLGRKPELVEAG